MAIYHCNISVTSRTGGHSAVAGAAYLSRSSLVNERDGITHNYTRAHRHERLVADLGVTLPEHAPERWLDRSTLWNEVETVERSANAQLCRRIEYALPDELDEPAQIELAKSIARDFAQDGMVVDCCVHVGVDGTNAHAHMLMPLRSCDESGFLAKSVNVYRVRDAHGSEADLTASELREANDAGRAFEKIYTYRVGSESRQLTPTEAADWEGCKRVGKTPAQSTRYLNDWNEKGKSEEWRARIADRENAALESAGLDARVSHMSYERQGIERIPTLHEGPGVKAIEKRALEHSEAANIAYEPATEIRQENVDRERVNNVIERLGEAARTLTEQIRSISGNVAGRVRETVQKWTLGLDRARAQLVRSLMGREPQALKASREVQAEQARRRMIAASVVAPARERAAKLARERERDIRMELQRTDGARQAQAISHGIGHAR